MSLFKDNSDIVGKVPVMLQVPQPPEKNGGWFARGRGSNYAFIIPNTVIGLSTIRVTDHPNSRHCTKVHLNNGDSIIVDMDAEDFALVLKQESGAVIKDVAAAVKKIVEEEELEIEIDMETMSKFSRNSE
jgi:hypothetical protein